MTKQFYGTIPIVGEGDYRVNLKNLPQARNTYFDNKFQYNQDNQGYPAGCVFFAGAACIADNLGDDSWIDWDELAEKAENYGWEEDKGMYVSKGVDCVRHFYNNQASKENKIETRRIDMRKYPEEVNKILEKGYSIHGGYGGNRAYNKDMLDDCVLDDDSFGKASYYHSIRITKNSGKIIIDNYKGRNCNEYEVEDFFKKVTDGIFFRHGYIYIFKNDKMAEYITSEDATTNNRADIIRAWKNEVSKDDMIYDVYTTDKQPGTREYELDEGDVITRMLNDIQKVREA